MHSPQVPIEMSIAGLKLCEVRSGNTNVLGHPFLADPPTFSFSFQYFPENIQAVLDFGYHRFLWHLNYLSSFPRQRVRRFPFWFSSIYSPAHAHRNNRTIQTIRSITKKPVKNSSTQVSRLSVDVDFSRTIVKGMRYNTLIVESGSPAPVFFLHSFHFSIHSFISSISFGLDGNFTVVITSFLRLG
jgi:hypothetical protein